MVVSLVLVKRYFDPSIGSSRKRGKQDGGMTSSSRELLSRMKFEQYTLVLKDVKYQVGKKENVDKILNGVSVIAEPGSLVGLMGPSGGGKSTLLDAILSRKTVGNVSGKILLNGQEASLNFLRRVSAYVEQEDNHLPYLTVYESLLYAAELRLDPSSPREEYIEKVLTMVELQSLRDKFVGDPNESSRALSASERKRLSIGVELVSNPSILLLDEPTTGLNFRDATKVMNVVQHIAATGRTVICTVHQPSEEIFWMFDEAAILQTGGLQVYFGEVSEAVKYFQDLGVDGPEADINPADWLLDTVTTAKEIWGIDLHSSYLKSELHQCVEGDVQEWIQTGQLSEPGHVSPCRRTWTAQVGILTRRSYVSYFRNVSYNWGRVFTLGFFSFFYGYLLPQHGRRYQQRCRSKKYFKRLASAPGSCDNSYDSTVTCSHDLREAHTQPGDPQSYVYSISVLYFTDSR
eukprot:gb/GECG01005346.1/.p1 GENE.gb/GECG01005346.1/~~gb/GECG01005346.1/.p1  ORF type:complete len:461 (+),score=48.24 gb/GECG01005346.1/:1-1383(+)